MKRALIINSDRMEPVRMLTARPDVELFAIVKPKYSHLYAGIAETHCVSDVGSADEVLAAAYSLMGQVPFDGVLAPLERSVLSAAFVRSYLGIPGMDLGTAAAFANKFVMKRRLRAAGVAVADFAAVPALAELPGIARGLGWPVVLKPAVGAGTQRTWRFSSAEDVRAFLGGPGAQAVAAARAPLLAEHFIDMEAELHCDAIVQDGAAVAFSASRYFRPLLSDIGGFVGSYTLSPGDGLLGQLRGLHERVIRALGMQAGVTHLEVFQTRHGLVVGEVACRPGGGGVPAVVRARQGWDLWGGFIATSLGEEATPRPAAGEGPVTGWLGLPSRNGLIIELSTARDLEAIAGVCRVEMVHRIGQVLAEKVTSTFNAGVAYFAVPDYRAAELLAEQIRSRYRIETMPAQPGKRPALEQKAL
jgi:ATP-grasp domain